MMKIFIKLKRDNELKDKLSKELIYNDLKFYKYAPVTSTNVERSFSWYKNLLLLEIENLKKYKWFKATIFNTLDIIKHVFISFLTLKIL